MGNWQNTTNRFVAFFDIMGFKDLVFRTDHEKVLELMEHLHASLSLIEKFYQEEKRETRIRGVLFSDSILFVSSDDSKNSLEEIIFIAEWVLKKSFESGIPIKGSIAVGKQTADFDKSIHFGVPIIDAFMLQDELLFYGVVIHDSVEKAYTTQDLKEKLLIRYKAPFKSGRISHYVVDWRGYFKEDSHSANWLPVFEALYKKVSGPPRIYVDNTIEYYAWLEKNYKRLLV